MGFDLLPIEDGDENKYEIITINSPNRWNPQESVELRNHFARDIYVWQINSNYDEFKESAVSNLGKGRTNQIVADQDLHKQDWILLKKNLQSLRESDHCTVY